MNTKPAASAGRKAGLILSLAVSLGIVVYLFAKLDWTEVFAQLGKINPWFIPGLLMAFVPLIWLRALRWRLLLPNRDQLSVRRLMDATMIGFFASFVLPLRAGEIIRPLVVARWQPVTFSAALASIMVERLADSVCLLSLLLACLMRVPDIPPVILAGARILLGLSGALIAMILLSYVLPGRVEAFFHKLVTVIGGRFAPALSARINGMITEYFAGLRIIASFRQLIEVLVLSYAMWILVAVWYQALLWAFGEYPSFWVGMMLNVMIALAVAAPSAPGFIGVFQAGCILALSTVYGYSREFAMAYSVVGHLLQTVFNIGAGFLVLQARGLTLSQVRKSE